MTHSFHGHMSKANEALRFSRCKAPLTYTLNSIRKTLECSRKIHPPTWAPTLLNCTIVPGEKNNNHGGSYTEESKAKKILLGNDLKTAQSRARMGDATRIAMEHAKTKVCVRVRVRVRRLQQRHVWITNDLDD